jgi:hypothetical protein
MKQTAKCSIFHDELSNQMIIKQCDSLLTKDLNYMCTFDAGGSFDSVFIQISHSEYKFSSDENIFYCWFSSWLSRQ